MKDHHLGEVLLTVGIMGLGLAAMGIGLVLGRVLDRLGRGLFGRVRPRK